MPKSTESVVYLLSNNRPLFEALSTLLHSRNSEYSARFIDTRRLSKTDQYDFSACDMVLCDMAETALFETAHLPLLNRVPCLTPLIGLENGGTPAAIAETPSYVRLAGVTSLQKGLDEAWEKVLELRRVWKSPYMHSRIEDVSPCDVLQMIGISQWTAVVRIESSRKELNAGAIKGCISFCKGIPECAWSTHHTGMDAVLELLSLRHGALDVVRRVWPGGPRNVHGTIEEILMTHALGIDEAPPEAAPAGPVPAAAPQPPSVHWPEKGPKATLDSFWNRRHDAVEALLAGAGARECPLRWMKWRELERLVVSEIQTQFLVFFGDGDFVRGQIGRFAPAVKKGEISGETIPVVRAGKAGHSMLYLIGICGFNAGMRVLSRFPFVMHGDRNGFHERLSAALRTGVRALVLLSSDPVECLAATKKAAADREWNACSIAVGPDAAEGPCAALFAAVSGALSRMAAEKNA